MNAVPARACYNCLMPEATSYPDEITLRDLVEVLKRRWRLLVAVPALAVAAAAAYLILWAKPAYEAAATVSISPLQVQARLEEKIQVEDQPFIGFSGYRSIAYSEPVLREVLAGLRQQDSMPEAWRDREDGELLESLADSLKLKDLSPKNAQAGLIVEHRAREGDPRLAAEIANLWVDATLRRVNAVPVERTRAVLEVLEERLSESEARYRKAQQAWEAFQRTSTLEQDQAALSAFTNERVRLEGELAQLRQNLAAIRARIQAVQAQLEGEPERLSLERSVFADPLATTLLGQRGVQEAAELRLVDQELNPVYVRLQQTLVDARTEEARLTAREAALQERLEELEARIADLKARVAEAQVRAQQVQEQLDLARSEYIALAQKRNDLRIEAASVQRSLAQVLAPAYPMFDPVAPKTALILALALVLGGMLALVWAFVADALQPAPEGANASHTMKA
ncbi:lipopolysaccharide biosynthesis protein [Marinithermus hydrothermalis DSM 14884]|uniref:Lipopolysaccharide biosynthesis protein n=2 Tax=Marinithermus TaxID=186191 RepID=F2NN62_MARHT|nr:lipopolysaccharide biosynthesis protein [Marinithermus hydrothermalis DSM 14884]